MYFKCFFFNLVVIDKIKAKFKRHKQCSYIKVSYFDPELLFHLLIKYFLESSKESFHLRYLSFIFNRLDKGSRKEKIRKKNLMAMPLWP